LAASTTNTTAAIIASASDAGRCVARKNLREYLNIGTCSSIVAVCVTSDRAPRD
jgi:hypothetical protein